MIQTIIFISSITYITLGNRLLQQWQPPQLPPQLPPQANTNQNQAPIPQFPAQIQNQNQNNPPAPQIPSSPQLIYIEPRDPSQPWVPPSIPIDPNPEPPVTIPGQTVQNPGQVMTPYPPGLSDLNCQFPGSCANQQITLYNVADTFRWTCELEGACSGTSVTAVLNHMSSSVEMFEGINCKEGSKGIHKGSCEGASFTLQNGQLGGQAVEIEKFTCSGTNSCKDFTFTVGPNVKILKIECDYGQCDGCLLKVYETDVGTPCLTPGLTGDPFPFW